MKKYYIIILLIALFFYACAGSNKDNIKQEVALRDLGEALMAQGKYNAALFEFTRALEKYSKDPYLHNSIGLVYLAKKKLNLAELHFQKALDLKPDYPDAMNNLGIVYIEQKQIDYAIKCFKKVTNNLIYAAPHKPLTNLGMAYFIKKNYLISIDYYEKAIEIKPDYSIAQRGLARVYITMGKIDKAIDLLNKTMKQAPYFAEACYDLAEAYRLKSDFENALTNYQRVIRITPSSPLAKKARQQIDIINNNSILIIQ